MPLIKFLLLLTAASLPAFGGTITVTTSADSGSGSLRAAVAAANAGDTINFGGDIFSSQIPATIRLTTGKITITKPITINGGVNSFNQPQVVISGDANNSGDYSSLDTNAFDLSVAAPGSELVLNQLGFYRCGSASAGGAINVTPAQSARITFRQCDFISNHAVNFGGAFYSSGSVPVIFDDCYFSDNTATNFGCLYIIGSSGVDLFSSDFIDNAATGSGGLGGALGIFDSARLAITSCNFSENTSLTNSGAARIDGTTTTITGSTFSANTAATATLFIYSPTGAPRKTINISNSTFSANKATTAASAIALLGNVDTTIRHCTFTANTSNTGSSPDVGGTIFVRTNAMASFASNIIAGNTDARTSGTSAPDVFAETASIVSSQGGNLIGNSSGTTALFGSGDLAGSAANPLDPGLAILADNGGRTKTHALQALSPAINLTLSPSLTTDQRGSARPAGSPADSGAFELQTLAYTGWAATSLNTVPEDQRQRDDDPDGDGISNVMEYLQGSSPTTPGTRPDSMEISGTSLYYTFTLSREADLAGLNPSIAQSTDLATWTSASLFRNATGATFQSTTGAVSRYRILIPTAGRPRNFIRMVIP